MRFPSEAVAYYNPADRYIIKVNGTWKTESPLSAQALRSFLCGQGWDARDVKRSMEDGSFIFITGTGLVLKDEELITTGVETILNLYKPPAILPATDGSPQAWPRIQKILNQIIGLDEQHQAWATNWFAAKVQSPLRVMPTAQVWITQQGTGKSTFCKIMKEILGDKHVQVLKAVSFDRFQSFWDTMLLGFVEEINAENRTEFAEKLKSAVANSAISAERKYQDAKEVRSHAGFIFNSNTLAAIPATSEDRRYTMFGNRRIKTSEEHKEMLADLYIEGKIFKPDFIEEIRAWWRHLLDHKVDEKLVSVALKTETRSQSQRVFIPQVKAFADDWERLGLDKLIDKVKGKADDDITSSNTLVDSKRDDGFIDADYVFKVFVAHVKTKRSSRSTNTGYESFMAEISSDERFVVERDEQGQEWIKHE